MVNKLEEIKKNNVITQDYNTTQLGDTGVYTTQLYILIQVGEKHENN